MTPKFPKIRSLAYFLVKTRFTMGSAGEEVPSFHERFDDDPRVLSVDLVRRNLAMGIPGFVEGGISARPDVSEPEADALIRDISEHIRALGGSDARIHPIDVSFGPVSMRVTGDEEVVDTALPALHLARGDRTLVSAGISGSEGPHRPLLSCTLVVAHVDDLRPTFRRWVETLSPRATLTVKEANGKISFNGESDSVPENAFDAFEELGRRFTVVSAHSRSGDLKATIADREDILEAKQVADAILGPGNTASISGGHLFIDDPGYAEAAVTIVEELERVTGIGVRHAAAQSGGRTFSVAVDGIGDTVTVARALDDIPAVRGFGRVTVTVDGLLPARREVAAPPGELRTWAEALTALDRSLDAERIVLDPRRVVIDLPEVPPADQMRHAARVLKPLLDPDGKVQIRPGSVAPYTFLASDPDKKSPLMPKHAKAGLAFAREWKTAPG